MAIHNLADADRLGVTWYHEWNYCGEGDDARCVDMSYDMSLPPTCPPVLLVGNEPNAIPPFGFSVTPKDAVDRVTAIEAQCPGTKLVMGNVSADNWKRAGGWGSGRDWIKEFLAAYDNLSERSYTGAVGVHCFTTKKADYCIRRLSDFLKIYKGEVWITEFGILSGNASELTKLLAWIAPRFTWFAIYTNREPHDGNGWELGGGVELVNPDGSLTPAGSVYAGS